MLEINFDDKAHSDVETELSNINFLYNKGDYVEAFSQGVMLQEKMPNNVALHNLVGASELALGDPKAAANSYAKAIEADPYFLASYINLGSLYRSIGMNDEALSIYKIALKMNDKEPRLYYNIGNLLMDFQEYHLAQESFQEALDIDPGHFDAHYNLALSLIQEWKRTNSLNSTLYSLEENSDSSAELLRTAKIHLEKAEPSNRKNSEYYQLMAEIQLEQGDLKNSEKNSKKSISLDTNSYESYINLARVRYRVRDFEGAASLCETALKIKPNVSAAKVELGLAKFNIGKVDEATKIFNDLIIDFPDNNDILYNLSLSLGAAGKYKEAWEIFSSRFKLGMDRENFDKFAVFPNWNGSKCKSIAVWQEQGVGDVIFFSSMLKELSDLVENVSVFIDSRLIKLFKNSFPDLKFIDISSVIMAGDYEAQVPLGDLPLHFRNKVSDFPINQNGFLIPPKEKIDEISTIKEKGKLICGLSWYTKASQENDDRAIELERLIECFDGLDIELVNLQYPIKEDKASTVSNKLQKRITTLSGIDLMNDFTSVAAVIDKCDIIVTIDNIIAHLASSLGKRTIVMLPAAPPNYRWPAGKKKTPWYPDTTLLLRKAQVGCWSDTLNDLSSELKKLIEKV